MKPASLRLIAVATVLAAGFLAACDLPFVAGGSSSTETGKKVSVTGRVAGGNGDGLAGVVVSLTGTPLADTTDLSGEYRLAGRAPDSFSGSALRFSLQGQTLARKTLSSLVDSLPELRFVQRGFSGRLDLNGATVTRVAGIVTGDGVPAGDSLEATFFHNAPAGNYSGFVYFPFPGEEVLDYVVHVNVEGPGGTRLGRSVDVPFNSLAGNVLIPDIVLTVPGASP